MPAPSEDQLKEIPPAPKRLGNRGKRAWKTSAGQLIRQGLLTPPDLELLEEYCVLCDVALEMEQDLATSGFTTIAESGYECQRAQVSILNKTREHMRQFANELGLTPSSRTKLGVKAGQAVKDRMAAARAKLRDKSA